MQRLSIIIPTLNEAGSINQTLALLQPLRSRGHEVILVDGGSTDDTVDMARPEVDRILNSDPGRAHQMNVGASQARGDIFWFLHADTLIPELADQIIAAAIDNQSLAWGRFDVRLDGKDVRFRLIALMMNRRSRLSGIATGDQGIFVTRALFEKIGGFAEQPLMEDIEISRRLKRHVRPNCLKQELITSSRRWETRGIWRTVFLMWRLRLRYALGGDPHKLAKLYR
ncbi:TIGR04283 family arsenosugar biosynthesis glycosyltransferase [Thiohalophilus thiocyanatoxydans]|uniref:RSAM/selenodomain-associated transferase 2 n=1 Tax=Thiohalophilus thiocyanatoxydans TaxID=381308 RepID=A0A4R8IY35_9GAMM|nr:TIGR04283 family arsenosugar biosynthesis glycosyltransferase [Thiohalophilus thiocyanatoxydans]TDY02837.1 rSAM/selenodomain-associated transferase 2 [Thiohalophilus thiocyanatoxydans]